MRVVSSELGGPLLIRAVVDVETSEIVVADGTGVALDGWLGSALKDATPEHPCRIMLAISRAMRGLVSWELTRGLGRFGVSDDWCLLRFSRFNGRCAVEIIEVTDLALALSDVPSERILLVFGLLAKRLPDLADA